MARRKATTPATTVVPAERIERSILVIRGEKVLLDSDLAALYQVETRVLVQAVKRNIGRFPSDFAFRLTEQEFRDLRSQIVISSWGGRRTAPYAFTEHGAVMAATVLNSPVAVLASIEVVRTFVRLRQMLASHEELARKLDALEKKYDAQFRVVFDAIRQLMAPPTPEQKKRRIGFRYPGESD
jgi:ORF6N domain